MAVIKDHQAKRYRGTAAERAALATANLIAGDEFIESVTFNIWEWDGNGWKHMDAGGTGVANQVAYWTAATTLAGDAGLTYNAATDTITLAGGIVLTGAANSVITLNDNAANALTLVDVGGLEYLRLITTDAQPIVIWNEGGADVDHRWEAAGGITNALFIQGSNGNIGLRTNTPRDIFEIATANYHSFRLSNSNVAHGVTAILPTDTAGTIGLVNPNQGGLMFRGLTDTAGQHAFQIFGVSAANPTAATISFSTSKANGINNAPLAASERALDLVNYTSLLLRVLGDGKTSLGGVATPTGLLHGHDTIGGFLYWEYDGVAGVAIEIIPNGAGDVVYVLFGMSVVRASDGGTGTVSGGTTPGNSYNPYDVGGDTLTLAVAADGSVTVQRTAGALTYKVALWLIWL